MHKITAIAMVALVLVLALGGTALAATTQDIYNDYADNGKLDGTYTIAEIEAYLNDATVHQYGSAGVLTPLDGLLTAVLGAMKAGDDYAAALAKALGTSTDTGGRATLPFTGAELAVILLGAVALLGGGVALRRATR
ncbi:MAG: hypothetical protein ACYC5Q_12780 [Thermoleophilia bacterium]